MKLTSKLNLGGYGPGGREDLKKLTIFYGLY